MNPAPFLLLTVAGAAAWTVVAALPPPPRVPRAIIDAVIQVESAGDPRATRYEPKLQRRFNCNPKLERCRLLATSLGLMQVVPGFHLERCGLREPEELFDPKTNVLCGTAVLEDCYARAGSWRGALRCYNGSDKYPNRVFAVLGEGRL